MITPQGLFRHQVNRQQHPARLHCDNVVRYAGGEHDELAGGQLMGLTFGSDAKPAVQRLNENSPRGLVLRQQGFAALNERINIARLRC